jgi:hypothetical protein
MLRREKANVPALINNSRPNRTSGRLVKANVRSPLVREYPQIRVLRRHPTNRMLADAAQLG